MDKARAALLAKKAEVEAELPRLPHPQKTPGASLSANGWAMAPASRLNASPRSRRTMACKRCLLTSTVPC